MFSLSRPYQSDMICVMSGSEQKLHGALEGFDCERSRRDTQHRNVPFSTTISSSEYKEIEKLWILFDVHSTSKQSQLSPRFV